MATRTRLAPEERRAQLLALGVELLSERSLEELSTDDLAVAAGVSRSLLFHYFPSKREFHLAVVQAAADELIAVTEPDGSLPPERRLLDSLERYVDHVAAQRKAYVSLVRGAASGDEAVRGVFDATRDRFAERILENLADLEVATPPLVALGARAWVAFAEEAALEWLARPEVSRGEVLRLLRSSFFQVIWVALGGDPPFDVSAIAVEELGAVRPPPRRR